MDFSSIPKALFSLTERISTTTPGSENTDRERVMNAIEELKLLLPPMMNVVKENHANFEMHLKALLEFGEKMTHWESIAVSFYILDKILNASVSDGENHSLPSFSEDFRDTVISLLNKHRENKEHRVRNFLVKLSGSLCKIYGLSILSFNRPDEQVDTEQDDKNDCRELATRIEVVHLLYTIEKQLVREEHSFTPAPLYTSIQSRVHYDGISGWNSLESNVLLLASIVEGTGSDILQDQSLKKLLFDEKFFNIMIESTKIHLNRHIREATYTILRALIRSIKRALVDQQILTSKTNISSFETLSSLFRSVNENITLENILATLELGLRDTWPQVIYAASTSTKLLLELFPISIEDLTGSNHHNSIYIESVLPYLCMNRYYVPEGVQSLSQRIWEETFQDHGKLIFTSYLNSSNGALHTTEVYNRALQALNPFNRVSALYSINELINKIDLEKTQIDFLQFSENLIYTLNDEHWEVRIAACETFASLFLSCPEFFNLNTKVDISNEVNTIKDLLVLNLFDNCWSLREAAANALANALQAELKLIVQDMSKTNEGETNTALCTKNWIFNLISTNIEKAKSEQEFQNAADYQQEKQDFYKHSGKYLLNCCGGGNHSTEDHHFQLDIPDRIKLQQPWFKTDGTVYLVTALTRPSNFNLLISSTFASPESTKTRAPANMNPSSFANKELSEWLYSISNLCLLSHFGDIYKLKCTIYDNLSVMASNLGKKYIKKYVDNFIPSLFQAVVDPLSPKLLTHSASECIYKLYKTIGATIFVAHLPQGGCYHQELNKILSRQRETKESSPIGHSIYKFSDSQMNHTGNMRQFDNNHHLKL